VGAELPLVSRRTELAVLTGAIDAALGGRGEAVLLTGEAGVGKTRLLVEARREAERPGVVVLRGRAVESGGAYRPLVDAFTRASAPFADEADLARVRPTLARVLPGWVADEGVLAPMADPAAVLAEALIVLLGAMAADATVVILDDMHWADEDTVSVLTYLADSAEELPVALLLAARTEPLLPASLERLSAAPSIHRLPLRRLTPIEVRDALRVAEPELATERLDQLVAAVDGLPLVLDEFVRQLREGSPGIDAFDVKHTTLAAAVQLRLTRVSPETRVVLDAMSVIGETDAELLAAVTGLDDAALSTAIHDGVASTLLVTASTPLGVTWRHRLMRDAVQALLLPLEQQAMARRAADHLGHAADPTDGQLHQAAAMYELAGYPNQAAQELIRAARIAVGNAALNVAEHYLNEAHALTGTLPEAAQEVLIERIDILAPAGRAADAYRSGVDALNTLAGRDTRRLLVATTRAAYGAGLNAEATQLLRRLEDSGEVIDPDLAVLRAHAALADRRTEAITIGEHAAALAQECGRFDVACEALLVVGHAARRHDTDTAVRALHQALSLSEEHRLPVWQVRILAELGLLDTTADSDPTRFYQARELATAAGMAGMVARIDLWIAEIIGTRSGWVAAYPVVVRADAQARLLQLNGLSAAARAHLAQCLVNAEDHPLPGRMGPSTASEVDDLIAQALTLGQTSQPVPWAKAVLGIRAWFQGDDATAIQLFDEALRFMRTEVKVMPLPGVGALLRVVAGTHPEEAFGPPELLGHHCNWAARAYGNAVQDLRKGRSGTESIAEAEEKVRHTPFMRHWLRTIIVPVVAGGGGGVETAVAWLREADAFCTAAGERALQRRVRRALGTIGAKVPRTSAGTVPPHLARLGITARETEILRLVNIGLSNHDIADRLFISVRTVESHISSMLQKAGRNRREQLPLANASDT
jgi:DNA-binding CsgD family transcriptional regulator/tetratricopeptide (TPR) repeat protein